MTDTQTEWMREAAKEISDMGFIPYDVDRIIGVFSRHAPPAQDVAGLLRACEPFVNEAWFHADTDVWKDGDDISRHNSLTAGHLRALAAAVAKCKEMR